MTQNRDPYENALAERVDRTTNIARRIFRPTRYSTPMSRFTTKLLLITMVGLSMSCRSAHHTFKNYYGALIAKNYHELQATCPILVK